MSVLPADAAEVIETTGSRPVLHLVPAHEHDWELRDTEYDNGLTVRRFECRDCTEVRFT